MHDEQVGDRVPQGKSRALKSRYLDSESRYIGMEGRMKILFATNNADKMREIRKIMKDVPYEITSLKEEGIFVDVVEDGNSFVENAIIKAKEISTMCKDMIVMADDSGLVIDALNGEPGIYSARYMGEDTSYRIKNANLIERVGDRSKEERTARFVCAIAAVFPDGTLYTTEEAMEGYIGYEEKGENGFGYDPIFVLSEYNMTSAELSDEVKNSISHRGKALEAMKVKMMRGQNESIDNK